MTQDEIIEMAKEAGLHVAHDSEGHFSGVTNEEIIDMYPDPTKDNPLKPWAPKQIREYAQQQRNKEEESPL